MSMQDQPEKGKIPLAVQTARVSYGGPDRFDITRKSGGVDGAVFAPSWAILRPALEARGEATRYRRYAKEPDAQFSAESLNAEADRFEREAWAVYEPAYIAEMRESYRAHRDVWNHLLSRSRVVLVCYCTDAARCHRTLLAGILGKLGADVRGELPR